MTEDIVFNITANVSELEHQLANIESKYSATNLAERFMESKTNLKSLHSMVENELKYNSGTYQNLPQGFKTPLMDNFEPIIGQIKSLQELLKAPSDTDNFFSSINTQVGYLTASVHSVIDGVKNLKTATASLSSDQLNTLSKNIPDLTRALTKTASNFLGIRGSGAATIGALSSSFMNNEINKTGYNKLLSNIHFTNDKTAQKALLESIAQVTVPTYMQGRYYDMARKYSSGVLRDRIEMNKYTSFRDRLPQSLKDIPSTPVTMSSDKIAKAYHEVLSEKEFSNFVDLARSNNSVRNALVELGYGKYGMLHGKAGSFNIVPRENFTKQSMATIVDNILYRQLKPALEGNPIYYTSWGAEDERGKTTIANRGNKLAIDAYEALPILQQITGDLAPLHLSDAKQKFSSGAMTVSAGRVKRGSRESYIVPALTYSDFKNAKMPENDRVVYDDKTTNGLDGKSYFVSLQRSRMTELAGMKGNNTFGNGIIGNIAENPEMAKGLPMLMIDFSSNVLEKDKDGNLSWTKNGDLVRNKGTEKAITDLLTPKKYFNYNYNGKAREYWYPAITRKNADNEEETYVPVSVKNGKAILISEEQYAKESKSYLENYGRNIFDNYADPDFKYEYLENANKVFEGRNRLLTPSVPFAEVGGRIPKSDKTAVVDMKAAFGIDGSMFMMPGYIPGGNAVIRMPALNLKGAAQSFDFKSAIKENYGLKDGQPFYVPGLNTPEELLGLYKSGKLKTDPTYGDAEYQKTMDKYFVDIMKYDALISDSLIKSPLFTKVDGSLMYGEEANKFLQARLKKASAADLYRLVETAEEHSSTRQTALSAQASQHLIMSNEDIAINEKKWDDYILKLAHDVNFQKEHIFNGTDALSIAFREDPTIRKTNSAVQTKINETISTAIQNRREGKLYGRNSLSMQMTLVNPFYFLSQAARANGLKGGEKESAYMLSGGQIAGSSAFKKNSYGGFRYPVNAGELFALSVSQPYNEAIKNGKYGLSKYGLYMNPETIEKMGGGDFDGDQIQLTSGWIADVIKQTEEKINPEIEKQAKQLVKPEKQHLPMPGDGKMSASVMSQIVMRAAESSIHMGMVSNAEDAISQLDLSDPEVMQKYGRTIATLKQMYDVDSTYLKTGILAKFDKDTRAALHLGKPFSSIYKNLYSAIENSDITKFRKFSETNFPSIFDNRTSIMMSGGRGQYFHDDNIEKLIAAQRELEGITYDLPTDGKITTAEQARAVYLDKNIKIMSDVINRRAVVSNKSYDNLSSSLATWREKIDEEKKTLSKKNVTDLPRLEALSKQEREIRAQTGRLKALESMGLLQKNVEAGLGYAQYKRFDRSPLTEQYADFLSGAKEASNEKDLLNLRDFQARATTAIEADRIRQLNGAPLDVKTFFRTQQAYAIQQANDMTYSYSMLKKFKEDRARWYRQYVENIWDEPKNSSQFLGTAFHETAESFAKDLMAQQSDPNKRVSTPEELKKTFYKKLIEPDKQTHQVFFKEDNGKIKELTGKKTIDKKVELAAKTLELLPEILKDYEILGVEQSVDFHDTAPEKINSIDGSKVNTTGKVDLILRNRKTGMVNWLDWKPYDIDPNNKDPKHDALNQLLLYAGSDRAGGKIPAPDSLQALNYLNPDGLKTSLQNQFIVSADIVKECVDEFNKDTIEVLTCAKDTGFNKLVMLNHKDVRLSDLNAGNILREKMKQEAMQNFLTQGIVPYGYTIPKAEEGPSSAEILGSQLQADRDRLVRSGFDKQDVAQMNELEVNQSLADVQRGDAAKKGTGKGIAAAMQFYKELNDWDDTLGKSIQEVMKRQYRITDERYNPWKSTQKALDEAEEKLDSFNTQGISPKDIKVRQTKLEEARQIRRNALLTVADGDMRKLKEDLDKAEISPKGKTATGSFADQYAALEKRIETAKQARDYVYGQVEWEDKNKGIVKKDSPITQTEWDKIANQEAELDKTVQSVRDRLVRDSAAVFDADIAKMYDVSKYGKLQTNTVIKNQLDSFARWKDDAFKQLELEYKDGYLTGNEKEYTRRKSMLDSIRQEDYENTLYAQEAKNSDKLLNQYNKFERRNNVRSGRNVYRQMLNRREDSIDALKNYKEAMSEKQTLWKERAEQIRAGWGKEDIARTGDTLGYMNLDSWKQASSEVQKYGAAIASVQKQLDSFGNKHTKIASGAEAMIASMNNMITMYARRFARQLVQQAAQFVKQYDAAITEIQVVTRKSDEEVNQLGENMMKVAKDLKVSFSDVAKATTELYRQGLSDEEVDERREQVLKFSKVAGVSATDATKLITVGVNSGLFKDAKEVTDVVTALGDSAATNAGQIQKGIQKAGYAAKEAGVSGKELSAMLTVITAGTQLSGNVAGTTLRNVFSRINRVKNPNEVVYDEKGNAMTANTLAAVLNSAGISMYENGQMKGTTQILTDIGKVWDSLSDNKKNQIAYQLGGTQQYSNVAALMAGFSETDENGQTLMEKYLQLADESGNIVDEKYVDQADSLTAALTNLSNAFNALTSSVTDSEAIKSFIDILADAVEGVAELNSALGGVPSLLAAIGIAAVALASHPVIAGILVSILGLGAAYKAISGIINPEPVDYSAQAIENIDKKKDENDKKENSVNNLIEKITAINKKAQDKTATYEDFVEYNKAASELQHLGISCVSTVSSLEKLMNGATNAATELNNAANSAKNLADSNAASILNTLYNSINDGVVSYVEEIEASDKDNERIKEDVSDFITTNFYENKRTGRLDYVLSQGTDLSSIPYEKFSKLWEDPEYLNFANSRYATAHAIALLKSGALGNIYLKNAHGERIEAGTSTLGVNWDNYTNDDLSDVITDPAFKEAYTKHYYKTYYDADENDTVPEYDFSVLENKQLGELYRGAIAEAYSSIPSIANSGFLDQTVEYMVQKLNDFAPQFVTKNGDGEYVPNSEMIKAFIVEPWTNDDGTSFDENKYEKFVEDERFKTANSADTQSSFNLGAIATSAASLSTDNKYGNAAAKMYWKLLATDGTPAERFGSLMDMINNDSTLQPIVEAMISDSDHSELAKAFSYMFKSDSTDSGNYEIKEDLSDLDIAALMVALANADESGTLPAYNHQSKQVVSSNAMTVLKALRKNPEKISEEWGNLGKGNNIVAEMLRDNFSTILGEETTSKLLNGQLNDLGMSYAERMISAYGNESAGYTDYEYAGLAEQVLGGLDANLTPEAKLSYINSLPTEMIDALKEKISGFEDYVNLATMSAEGKENSGVTDAKVADARKAFELGISDAKIRDLEKYNENLDELATLLTQVGKGGKNAADAMQTINSKMDQNRYNRWALNQYKSGDRSETVTKQLSSGFGIDQAELKEASKSSADFFIKSMEQELEGQTTELNNTASIVLNEMWQDVRQTIPESFDLDSYIGIGGVFDVSGFLNACREAGIEIDAEWAALVANAASHSATLRLTADGSKLSIDVSGTSAKPKSSGGGGGGKSDADKLVDKIKKGQALYEHRVKMVQYKQTEYTNADELTNYGRMIEKEMEIEQSYLPVVQENIQKLKEQMAKTKVGSDDWYTLRDAILSAEETYAEINKTLDENKKKLEENQQAILKLHTDLEDSVTEEIKNRIQKERDMTDGAVTMQETILNAIKQRHQDEWDLIKKDIEKKKEALEEEKSLIDERLQARKDAEDEAEKYEELAELKKQLASVEMDSSRTKDAAQLRKSIADLEKEIGWDITDKEADNAKNEIQDQMDAYDDYITKGDEDLEELLKDANNFSEEVNNVLKMNQSELFDWLKNNVKEYTESLKDAQQQMVNSWSDTYKQMMGLTDTYWDEVAEILSSKESYLEYMKNSDEYLNASDDMKAQLRYQWEDAYDKWILALKDTTNYDHFDNGLGDMSGSEYGTGTNSGTGAGGNKTTSPSGLSTMIKNAIDTVKKSLFGGLAWDKPNVSKEVLDRIVRGKFATGGVANYTGLAWLDGTPSKPERVLNAQQTESFERLVNVMDSLRASGVSLESLRDSMLDTRIHLPNLSPSIDPSTIGGNIANIGDINVTIEEAELNDDRDYDEIAQIVGEKFAKEISKQGINIAKYNF